MTKTFITCAAFASLASLAAPVQQAPAVPPPGAQEPNQTVRLGVEGGGPPKLAIAPFVAMSQDAETVAAAKTIGDVLFDDIDYEREFYLIKKDMVATAGPVTSIDNVNLAPWKELTPDGLVVGSVRKDGTGAVVQVKLIQVSTGRMLFGKEYSGPIANPRRYAHTISDELHKQQVGIDGVARTRLTFSSDRDKERAKSGVANRDVQEIYIADYDGANPRRVTNTTTLNITPVWSPDSQAIAYTSYRPSGEFGTYQDIIVSYIQTGERATPAAGSPQRQNYLPIYSPDGSRIAFTTNRDGNPEIYVMNRDGSNLRRMTNNPAIDVTPTWSPSGDQLAWVSDRTGAPHIYVMNADGTGVRQLISEYCDRPTWSSGQFNEIAYAARTGPGYDVKVYNVATGETKKLTDGIGSNESPAFSPNGRHIAFTSTRNGKIQIYTIDRTGENLRQITREGNNKFPNWSR
ncbi:MAG TPA: DPP IV N-terminal domain-containing protein [Vicinamibacterales bacterium]|jgi:TolB protein